MSQAGGFKGKKPEVEYKREDYDKYYYRINKKTGRSKTREKDEACQKLAVTGHMPKSLGMPAF